MEKFRPENKTIEDYIYSTKDLHIQKFYKNIEKFPFYKIIQSKIKRKIKGSVSSKGEEVYLFVKEMLLENGFNYGFYPKALLPFHNYKKYSATPFEEHLKEAALYTNNKGVANLHFTISERHTAMFSREFASVEKRVSKQMQTTFNISYSNQKSRTDTIAVTPNNILFRNPDGNLLFRPGGHGALIENLNEQNADIIFIKNIDNTVVSRLLKTVANSKKILAGQLLKVQDKAFKHARELENDKISNKLLQKIEHFLRNSLNVVFLNNFSDLNAIQKIKILRNRIDRPIRVCGMVKNDGEPGGGPFWVKDEKNHISLQIIESAQIDMADENQANILKNATHFNPVDIVCGVKNYKGQKYNLLDFIDHKQGFISQKTKLGKDLKALELPGLWNGAMAFWNTVFVEVPLVTFNPVKTINDLLKQAHQPI